MVCAPVLYCPLAASRAVLHACKWDGIHGSSDTLGPAQRPASVVLPLQPQQHLRQLMQECTPCRQQTSPLMDLHTADGRLHTEGLEPLREALGTHSESYYSTTPMRTCQKRGTSIPAPRSHPLSSCRSLGETSQRFAPPVPSNQVQIAFPKVSAEARRNIHAALAGVQGDKSHVIHCYCSFMGLRALVTVQEHANASLEGSCTL